MCGASRACKEVPLDIAWTWGNALGESVYWAITNILHELLGGHINSRRWVPSNQWYDAKGPTDMGNILLSWQPHWEKDINIGGEVGRGAWKNWWEIHEGSKEKDIMGRRKSCSDSRKGAWLYSNLHGKVKTKEVQCQSDTRTPSMTPTITSWTSQCRISPTQSINKLKVQP